MGEQVIVLTDLTKKYGNFTAVDHISLSICKGEIFGLLGPNGAGKSTTILMMLGLFGIFLVAHTDFCVSDGLCA